MVRFVPHVLLIALSLLIWTLWQNSIYPFGELLFTYNGYGMHVVGGFGYAATQLLFVQAVLPSMYFTSRFFLAQMMIAVLALGAVEFLQVADPSRTVQLEDVAAQSLGACAALLILWLCERTWQSE